MAAAVAGAVVLTGACAPSTTEPATPNLRARPI